MRIILLDDMPDEVRRYLPVVKKLGHDCDVTADGEVAIHLLETEKFDALITDVSMPLMSGYELVQRIYYFSLELPCLVHSSEPRHSTGHEWIELSEIHKKFPFATFRLKRRDVDPSYISDFLTRIETK